MLLLFLNQKLCRSYCHSHHCGGVDIGGCFIVVVVVVVIIVATLLLVLPELSDVVGVWLLDNNKDD